MSSKMISLRLASEAGTSGVVACAYALGGSGKGAVRV